MACLAISHCQVPAVVFSRRLWSVWFHRYPKGYRWASGKKKHIPKTPWHSMYQLCLPSFVVDFYGKCGGTYLDVPRKLVKKMSPRFFSPLLRWCKKTRRKRKTSFQKGAMQLPMVGQWLFTTQTSLPGTPSVLFFQATLPPKTSNYCLKNWAKWAFQVVVFSSVYKLVLKTSFYIKPWIPKKNLVVVYVFYITTNGLWGTFFCWIVDLSPFLDHVSL